MVKSAVTTTILRELYVTFVMNHGSVLVGVMFSFPVCLISQLRTEGYDINTNTESIIGSISMFASGIGSFFFACIIGKAGRRRINQMSLTLYMIGMITVIFSTNLIVLYVGLVLASAVTGFFLPVSTTYVTEICQKERRGVLVSGGYLCMSLGSSVIYCLNAFLTWRQVAIISLMIAFLSFLQIFFIPETCYWYLMAGDRDRAKLSLLWFQPYLSKAELEAKINDIVSSSSTIAISPGTKKRCQFWNFVKDCGRMQYFKPFALGILVNLLRSGDGRAMVGIYLPKFLQHLRISFDHDRLITWFGVVNFIGAVFILPPIRKLGRKTAIMYSSATMIVFLAVLVAYKVLLNLRFEITPWIPVAALYAYFMVVLSAQSSLLPTILAEMQVAKYRAEATSIHGSAIYLFNCSMAFIFPYLEQVLAIEFIILLFIVNIALVALTIGLFLPETSKMEFYDTNPTNNKPIDIIE